MKIGIMQGRLSPPEGEHFQAFPRESWVEEFPRAREAGLDFIEWIYDSYGEDINPLASKEGIQYIHELGKEFSVAVESLCADYFMEHPLVRVSGAEQKDLLERLEWLLRQAAEVGVKWVVLPFVDNSELRSDAELEQVTKLILGLEKTLSMLGLELHLETSLAPAAFKNLLSNFDGSCIRANYDSGNSAANGFEVAKEFEVYGKMIGSVHIKDRKLGAGTVSLGEGDVDFESLVTCLRKVKYKRYFTLQAARDDAGDEVSWAVHNKQFLMASLGS